MLQARRNQDWAISHTTSFPLAADASLRPSALNAIPSPQPHSVLSSAALRLPRSPSFRRDETSQSVTICPSCESEASTLPSGLNASLVALVPLMRFQMGSIFDRSQKTISPSLTRQLASSASTGLSAICSTDKRGSYRLSATLLILNIPNQDVAITP